MNKKSSKRILALILALILLAATASAKKTDPAHEYDYVVEHKFTGAEVTAVPDELKEPDSRGGVVMRFPNMDFSKPDIDVSYANPKGIATELIYDEKGFYRYWVINQVRGQGVYAATKEQWLKIKPNRKYIFSALLWIDHDRINKRNLVTETIMGCQLRNEYGDYTLSVRRGVPEYTDGWQRFEYEFSTGFNASAMYASFMWQVFNLSNGYGDGNLCIADVALIELPEEELVPYKEGEGMVFRGGAGELDMRVESGEEKGDSIVVNTTGARYTFDLKNDTIIAAQKVNLNRNVSIWKSSADLSGLKIRSKTENECILSNENITFGIQLDSMMLVTPHKEDVELICTSEIAGIWNRLAFGNLTAMDGYGGFTVTPDIPSGTGDLPRCEALTKNLDFANYKYRSTLYFQDDKALPYNEYISNAKAGWQLKYTLSPGERLAITVSPPRAYDWKQSFETSYKNVSYDSSPSSDSYDIIRNQWGLDAVNCFNFADRGYAMEWQGKHTFSKYDKNLRNHVKAAKEAGVTPIAYYSGYFFYNRDDATEFMDEMKRLKDIYGYNGIYTDGLPSEHQWLVAYEEARMMRELFPDGILIGHMTGIHENGGPPLSSPAHFLPQVDTYFNATLKGEGVAAIGVDAPLAAITWSQYNIANCVGLAKGDNWHYYNKEGKHVSIPQKDQDILLLEYNGRARFSNEANWFAGYYPMMLELKSLWEKYGDEENFYEKYYAPKARELIRDTAAKYGNLTVFNETFDEEPKPTELAFYNIDANIAQMDENSVLKIGGSKSGSVFKRFSAVSGPLSIEYKFKVDERGNFDHAFSDNYDNMPITLRFGKDGRISFKNVAGYYVGIGRYSKNKWNDVRIEIDTDKKSFSIFVNGKEMGKNLKLPDNVYSISEVEFFSGGRNSSCYIDDIKIINKY